MIINYNVTVSDCQYGKALEVLPKDILWAIMGKHKIESTVERPSKWTMIGDIAEHFALDANSSAEEHNREVISCQQEIGIMMVPKVTNYFKVN